MPCQRLPVEILGLVVLRLDREPQVAAATGARDRRRLGQQPPAQAEAARRLGNVDVLNVDPAPAIPGRETFEEQTEPDRRAVALGDNQLRLPVARPLAAGRGRVVAGISSGTAEATSRSWWRTRFKDGS